MRNCLPFLLWFAFALKIFSTSGLLHPVELCALSLESSHASHHALRSQQAILWRRS
jgi:hypothetical protein